MFWGFLSAGGQCQRQLQCSRRKEHGGSEYLLKTLLFQPFSEFPTEKKKPFSEFTLISIIVLREAMEMKLSI